VKNADGTWPTAYGYSANFALTADAKGFAYKDLTIRVKPGTTGAANLRLRQGSTNLKTEAVTLANVAAIPLPPYKTPVPAKVSIAEARKVEAGKVVTVEGVITSKPGAFGGQGFYMQDGTAGVYVFQNTAGFNVGDRVLISAETDVFNTEFELTNPVSIEKVGTADVPAPEVVSLLSDANQGQLVTLQNVTIQNLAAAGTTGTFEFDAVSATGTTRVRVDNRTGLTLSKFPYKNGNVVSITGISAIFKGVYQLKPLALEAFAAETTAPTTTATLSGTANAAGWYSEDVTVVFTASDDLSGVAKTEYQINGGEWTTYTDPFIVTEGKNTIAFRSVDNNGNIEAAKSITINVDETAPTATFTQSGTDLHNVMIDGTVSFGLTAQDNLSGVATQELFLDDKAIEANKEISALDLGLGVHTVKVRVTDAAGNAVEENYIFVVETSFASINKLMTTFVDAGEVKNNGIATSIFAKLSVAKTQFDNAQVAQAEQHLKQLQTVLGDYANTGKISKHALDVLNANIEYLLGHGLK
jgi:DNA/RNA endonuclease YhcR with UshA esterase domain